VLGIRARRQAHLPGNRAAVYFDVLKDELFAVIIVNLFCKIARR